MKKAIVIWGLVIVSLIAQANTNWNATDSTHDAVFGAAVTVTGLTTATGGLTVPGALKLTGVQTTSLTSTQNNFPLTSNAINVLYMANASSTTFTGFKCGPADCTAANDGAVLLINTVGQDVTLASNNGGSVAGNQIASADAYGSMLLEGTDSGGTNGLLKYDGTLTKWRVISRGGRQIPGNLFGVAISASNTSGASISASAASATVPTLIPNRADAATGICADAPGDVSICTSSVERVRFTNGVVGSNGVWTIGQLTWGSTGQLEVFGSSSVDTRRGIFYKSLSATQSGNAFEYQNSSGVQKFSVDSSGGVHVGSSNLKLSPGTPSPNHGSLGTGSTDLVGVITNVGTNTSVVLTFSAAFANFSACNVWETSTSLGIEVITPNTDKTAPTFSCTLAGVATNCNDFAYTCIGW